MAHIQTFENFMNESSNIKVGDTVSKKYASTEEDYTRTFRVVSITGSSAKLKDEKTGKEIGMFLNDLVKESLNEASITEVGNAIADDLRDFIKNVVMKATGNNVSGLKYGGPVKDERDGAAVLMSIIEHRYNL